MEAKLTTDRENTSGRTFSNPAGDIIRTNQMHGAKPPSRFKFGSAACFQNETRFLNDRLTMILEDG